MMVSERRFIRFSAASICDAIGASPGAACALGLPPHRPDGVAFLPKEDTVVIHFGIGADMRALPVGLVSLAVLLLAFCFRARVPLPRKAGKTARMGSDAVFLELTMDIPIDRATLRDEAVSPTGVSRQVDLGGGGGRAQRG